MRGLWAISITTQCSQSEILPPTLVHRSLVNSCCSAASKATVHTGNSQRLFFFPPPPPPAGGRYKRHVSGQQTGQRPSEEFPHVQQGPDVGAAACSRRRRGWKQPQLHPGEPQQPAGRPHSYVMNCAASIIHQIF